MRFANEFNQGLILGNAPVLEGQRMHTLDEFCSLVATAAKNHPNLRLSGTPLYDPLFNSPFAIRNHPDLLEKLPRVSGRVSIVTGAVAAPYLEEILAACGAPEGCVVPVEKEISCLITIDDMKKLNVASLTETVIIPGRAFVHDREASEVLGKDVIRGPEILTADGETSMGMQEFDVLTMEFEGFSALIQLMNQYAHPVSCSCESE